MNIILYKLLSKCNFYYKRLYNCHSQCSRDCRYEETVMRRYKSYLKKGLKLQLVVIPETGYNCQTCGKLCASKHNLIHHYLNAHIATKDYTCIKCKKKFHRNDNRIRHEKYCSINQFQTNK